MNTFNKYQRVLFNVMSLGKKDRNEWSEITRGIGRKKGAAPR